MTNVVRVFQVANNTHIVYYDPITSKRRAVTLVDG